MDTYEIDPAAETLTQALASLGHRQGTVEARTADEDRSQRFTMVEYEPPTTRRPSGRRGGRTLMPVDQADRHRIRFSCLTPHRGPSQTP